MKLIRPFLLPVRHAMASLGVACLFTACTTTPPGETTTVLALEEGVPGGTVLKTFTTTATITALDPALRSYTLKRADGKEATFTAPPSMLNYDQLRVGDRVKATLVEELAVSLRPKDAAPPTTQAASLTFAPRGAKPGVLATRTSEVTVKIWAINREKHEVALRYEDGTIKKYKVRPSANLDLIKPGDVVVAGLAESLSIEVLKP